MRPAEQQVGGAQDPVDRRLAGAEAVVESALGARLVDRQHRTGERSLLSQGPHPQEPGGRLLGAAQHRGGVARGRRHGSSPDQVGAVVDRDLRGAPHERLHVLGVSLVALPALGQAPWRRGARSAPRRRRPAWRAGWPRTSPPAPRRRSALARDWRSRPSRAGRRRRSRPASGRSRWRSARAPARAPASGRSAQSIRAPSRRDAGLSSGSDRTCRDRRRARRCRRPAPR